MTLLERSRASSTTATSIEDLDDLLDTLFDALNEAAPPGVYFGASPGCDSDYGFWDEVGSR